MAMDGREHEKTISTMVERINQMFETLREERLAVAREREILQRTNQAALKFLEEVKEYLTTAERVAASMSRMEGLMREGVGEAHRLVDKLPGRRMR